MTENSESERDIIRQDVRVLLDATGWSASRLAQEAGLAASTLSRFLNQDVKHILKYSTVRQLILAGLDRMESRARSGEPVIKDMSQRLVTLFSKYGINEDYLKARPYLHAAATRGSAGDQVALNEMLAGRGMEEVIGPHQRAYDLPVLGAARGGDDALFFDNGDIHERVPRPPNLEGVDNAFAVYMVGDSMEPRYFAGEYLYVNPNRPPNRNCFVVVEFADGSGMVKQFIRRDTNRLHLRQLNPMKELEFDNTDVKAVYRIVGAGEG